MTNPTIRETARLLNGTEGWVRSLARRGIIGDAFNNARRGKRYTYVIVPGRLAEFMRISEEELEERLEGVRDVDAY